MQPPEDKDPRSPEEVQAQRTAQQLFDDGYFSTSNRYKTVARMPEGQTALLALSIVAPDKFEHIMRNAERTARGEFLRGHCSAGLKKELSPAEFQSFKKLGGESA